MSAPTYVIVGADGDDVIASGDTPEAALEKATMKIRGIMPECAPEYGYMYRRVGYVEVSRVLSVEFMPEKEEK